MPDTELLDSLEAAANAIDHVRDGGDCPDCPVRTRCDDLGDTSAPRWMLCSGSSLKATIKPLIAQARKDAEVIAALREERRLADIMALRCLEACDGLMYDTPEDEEAILAVEAYNIHRGRFVPLKGADNAE